MPDLFKQIKEKLITITIFASEFKQEIFDKLTLLSEEKLLEADKILSDVLIWEKERADRRVTAVAHEADNWALEDAKKIEEIKKLISNL